MYIDRGYQKRISRRVLRYQMAGSAPGSGARLTYRVDLGDDDRGTDVAVFCQKVSILKRLTDFLFGRDSAFRADTGLEGNSCLMSGGGVVRCNETMMSVKVRNSVDADQSSKDEQ